MKTGCRHRQTGSCTRIPQGLRALPSPKANCSFSLVPSRMSRSSIWAGAAAGLHVRPLPQSTGARYVRSHTGFDGVTVQLLTSLLSLDHASAAFTAGRNHMAKSFADFRGVVQHLARKTHSLSYQASTRRDDYSSRRLCEIGDGAVRVMVEINRNQRPVIDRRHTLHWSFRRCAQRR